MKTKKLDLELTDEDQDEITRLIREGFTSGLLDNEKCSISWELKVEKYNNY